MSHCRKLFHPKTVKNESLANHFCCKKDLQLQMANYCNGIVEAENEKIMPISCFVATCNHWSCNHYLWKPWSATSSLIA